MYLNDTLQVKLRNAGIISNNEVLLKEGDLYIALNVLTKHRRIVNKDKALSEALSGFGSLQIKQSKILKG
jgi:hypothetical protein